MTEESESGSVRESYDALAHEYSLRIFHELEGKPLDRALLDEVASRSAGLICDLGCGPGHVARYLAQQGASVCGVDLSPGMVAQAQRLNPELRFEVSDMRSLPFEDGSLAAVVAMYSLIHFDDGELASACQEIARVLSPHGLLLVGLHRGSAIEYVDDLWGLSVDLHFRLFEPDEIARPLTASGMSVERVVERDPYPGVEVETKRFYVLATKDD